VQSFKANQQRRLTKFQTILKPRNTRACVFKSHWIVSMKW